MVIFILIFFLDDNIDVLKNIDINVDRDIHMNIDNLLKKIYTFYLYKYRYFIHTLADISQAEDKTVKTYTYLSGTSTPSHNVVIVTMNMQSHVEMSRHRLKNTCSY